MSTDTKTDSQAAKTGLTPVAGRDGWYALPFRFPASQDFSFSTKDKTSLSLSLGNGVSIDENDSMVKALKKIDERVMEALKTHGVPKDETERVR